MIEAFETASPSDEGSSDDEAPADAPAEGTVPVEGESDSGSLSDLENEESKSGSEPFNVRWQNLMSAFRTLTSWELFHGQLTVWGSLSVQLDGTYGQGSGVFEQGFGEIDSGIDFRRLRLSALGEIDSHLR